jgi:hypothetical protein
MKVVPMERNTIRRCEAVKRGSAWFDRCSRDATAWVETQWSGARRVADISGSNTARFTARRAVCSQHAAIVAAL